ncbi:hypothetical protein, partial [Paracoccus shanxieyensis]
PNRPHISSDISQCQKAKATKQPKPRQTFDAAQAIKSPEFPDFLAPQRPFRPPFRPFRRLGEGVFTDAACSLQAEKCSQDRKNHQGNDLSSFFCRSFGQRIRARPTGQQSGHGICAESASAGARFTECADPESKNAAPRDRVFVEIF